MNLKMKNIERHYSRIKKIMEKSGKKRFKQFYQKMKILTAARKKALISAFTVIAIVATMFSPIFTANHIKIIASSESQNTQCVSKIDTVVAIDISGSMASGQTVSSCKWKEYQKPYCALKTASDVTENWCSEQTQGSGNPCNFPPVFTPAVNSKITDAKTAVNSFLGNLGSNDQSGIVSFSANTSLDKQITSDHSGNQAAVNGLVAITGSGTNIGGAIERATTELGSERGRQKAEKTIIFLTDGKANRPNGTVSGENAADVNLAISNAQAAADLGYKIYTIGLGNEINTGMLQSIASISGGNYYSAPASSELAGIYNTIYSEISIHTCVPASISGYKYDDKDNNGINEGDLKLAGWEIILSGDKNDTAITDENGFYSFSGLMPGNYTVSEGLNPDKGVFIQTVPESNIFTFSLLEGENKENNNFANYFPVCGNNIKDSEEQCDDGNIVDGDGCSTVCENEITGPTPSVSPSPSSSSEPIISPSPSVSLEPSVSPTPSVEPTSSSEVSPTPSPSTDLTPTPTPVSVAASGGGGGGILIPELDITDEVKTIAKDGSITIIWVTSHLATSRVIYDTVSGKFFSNSNSPTYGFDFIKEGDDSGVEKVIFHSVTLTDLVPGMTYYYRAVSIGSLAISQEYSFTAPDPVIVISSPTPVPLLEPTPVPTVIPSTSPVAEFDPISSPASTPPSVLPNINMTQAPIISANIETSIVDYLKSIRKFSDFDSRAVLAGENGIPDYTGTAEQNIRLLALIKNPVPQDTSSEQIPEILEQEKNKAPENSAVNEVIKTSQEAVQSEPPKNKEFQAGLAGILGDNSFISGILNGINQTAVLIMALSAVVILAGKEYWTRAQKKAKS